MAKNASVEKQQPKLPGADVRVSQATILAERYGDIRDDIDSKKDLLQKQAELIVNEMIKTGQRVLNYTDQHGYKHTFTVIEGVTKLRHAKRMED